MHRFIVFVFAVMAGFNLYSQSFDIRVDSLSTPNQDSIYNQYTNLAFSYDVELIAGTFLPEGTLLEFDYSLNSLDQFSSSYTLQDTLFNGSILQLISPEFVLSETGDFDYCVSFRAANDTNTANNTSCYSLQVEPLQGLWENEQEPIEIYFTASGWTLNVNQRITQISVYNSSGNMLYSKEVAFTNAQTKYRIPSFTGQRLLIFQVQLSTGEVISKKVIQIKSH